METQTNDKSFYTAYFDDFNNVFYHIITASTEEYANLIRNHMANLGIAVETSEDVIFQATKKAKAIHGHGNGFHAALFKGDPLVTAAKLSYFMPALSQSILQSYTEAFAGTERSN